MRDRYRDANLEMMVEILERTALACDKAARGMGSALASLKLLLWKLALYRRLKTPRIPAHVDS